MMDRSKLVLLFLHVVGPMGCGEPPHVGATASGRPQAKKASLSATSAGLLQHAVVGGQLALPDEYPATGVLLYTVTSVSPSSPVIGAMLCTGSLIAPDVVLLAAHCQEPQLPTHYHLQVNYYFSLADDVSTSGPQIVAMPKDAVRVAAIEVHPDYEAGGQPRQVGHADDLALVYLEKPLAVAPATLASPSLADRLLVAGAPITIVGYGRSQELFYGAGDDGKKMVGQSSLAEVGTYELEVGLTRLDAYKCFGDSGGPTFVADAHGRARLVGITSRGAALSILPEGMRGGMACRRGAIDTRLDAYAPWLTATMEAACDSGLRPACAPGWRGLPANEP